MALKRMQKQEALNTTALEDISMKIITHQRVAVDDYEHAAMLM